jgi:hypothetical protein
MKLVKLIKICLNKTNSKVRIHKNVSDAFPIQSGVKYKDAQSLLIFNLALEFVICKVQENKEELELNGKHQLLAYADDINILSENIYIIKKSKEALLSMCMTKLQCTDC